MISAERLRELLHYDPDTGVFRWRSNRGNKPTAGMVAGRWAGRGYRQITVDGQAIFANRLAWLYMTGEHPVAMVDHINRDISDDRWCNLRAATRSQNTVNATVRSDNKLGLKGVYRVKRRARTKFRASLRLNGKAIHIGYFDTAETAHAAYVVKAQEIFGEYHCAG